MTARTLLTFRRFESNRRDEDEIVPLLSPPTHADAAAVVEADVAAAATGHDHGALAVADVESAAAADAQPVAAAAGAQSVAAAARALPIDAAGGSGQPRVVSALYAFQLPLPSEELDQDESVEGVDDGEDDEDGGQDEAGGGDGEEVAGDALGVSLLL